jgi:FMN-dependent NADH-azoreductase
VQKVLFIYQSARMSYSQSYEQKAYTAQRYPTAVSTLPFETEYIKTNKLPQGA